MTETWVYAGRCTDCLPGEDPEDDGCDPGYCDCWCHDDADEDDGDYDYD